MPEFIGYFTEKWYGSHTSCYGSGYVIYATWAVGICLICTHEPKGTQHPRASADISGKSRLHMLHMLCNTSGTLKICQNLPNTALLYIRTDAVYDYGIYILTFL